MIPSLPHRSTIELIDIDGTLCDSRTAESVWDQYPHDEAYPLFHLAVRRCPSFIHGCAHVAQVGRRGHVPLIITSRPEGQRHGTEAWLEDHVRYPFFGPVMRATGGKGTDTLETWQANGVAYKHAVLTTLREQGHTVVSAADDDPAVLTMYRQAGVPVIDARTWW